MTDWQARMTEDMKLRDFRPRTQEAYLLAAQQLVKHAGRLPDTLGEDDIRAYFLYLREQRKLAPSTLNIAVHGCVSSLSIPSGTSGISSIFSASTSLARSPSSSQPPERDHDV